MSEPQAAHTDLRSLDVDGRRAAREKRLPDVLALHEQGKPYAAIAAELHITKQTVANDIKYALAKDAQRREALGTRYVDLQLRRYTRLLERWYPIAEAVKAGKVDDDGREPGAPTFAQSAQALDKVKGLMQDINKLLQLGSYGENNTPTDEAPQFVFQQLNMKVYQNLPGGAHHAASEVVEGESAELLSGVTEIDEPGDDPVSGADPWAVSDRDGMGATGG